MIVGARAVAWLLLVAVLIVNLVPPDLRPTSSAPHDVEHFVVFLLMGAAFGYGYRGHQWSLGWLGVAYTAIIEILQLFVPGRHARVSDFVVDALAFCIGIALGTLLSRRSNLTSAPPRH
jgi:VanZ family protein